MYDIFDQRKVIYISLSIISFIMAFLGPTIFFYPIKISFITKRAEEIGTSPLSMVTGGVAFLLFSIMFLLLARMEKRKLKIAISTILLSLGLYGSALSLNDFYYLTKDSFVYSEPLTFGTSTYSWDDFKRVEEKIRQRDGVVGVDSVKFTLKNGQSFEFSSGAALRMYRTMIYRIEGAGGEYIRIVLE